MVKNILLTLLLNLIIFIVLINLYFITGFLAGFGSNDHYADAALQLFIGFAMGHLLLTVLTLYLVQKRRLALHLITIIEISLLWTFAYWYYN
jgi:hypothetical protein